MKRISKVLRVGIKFAVAASFISVGAQAFDKRTKVVYGKDDRLDVYQVSDPALVAMADSTAAMISNASLNLNTVTNAVAIAQSLFGADYGLCKDEPFYSQPNGAMCSGVLVGPDLLATAGHCVSEFDCSSQSFVFNYKMGGPGLNPVAASINDVYNCKKVVARELTRNQDYALIQLDRPVVGHSIAKLSATPAKKGDSLILIGHPVGLPTKIAGGANVRKDEAGYFVANTDSYGGNSGSAVFSAVTGEVVGLLVRGEEDFKYDIGGQCMRSNYCSDGECRGEDITHIDYVIKALKSVQ